MLLPAIKNPRSRSSIAGLACGLAFFAVSSGARAEGPFAPLSGTWSGTGTITTSSGSSEKIRCRSTYAVSAAGTTVQQNMSCASDSYKLQISSTLTYAGGAVTGTWTESTRGATGNLNGQAESGQIRATIVGMGFSAGLGVSTRGSQQSLTIRPQGATDIRDVAINLKKG